MLHPIIGYYYDEAAHCVACTQELAAVGLLRRVPPLRLTTDAHGIARDLVTPQGDSVTRLHSTDALCADCNAVLA